MVQKYLAKTTKILGRSFCSRFYERLSLFCYGKLRGNIAASRKIIFLFLLMLCTEVNFSLDAPVLRSVHINRPYANTLDISKHTSEIFSFGKNYPHSSGAIFITNLKYSSLAAQARSRINDILNFIKNPVFTIFSSLGKLLMRDDRVIIDTSVKLSPIKAQGPPYLDFFISSLPKYLSYFPAISFSAGTKRYLFIFILSLFTILYTELVVFKTNPVKIHIKILFFKQSRCVAFLLAFIHFCFYRGSRNCGIYGAVF